jgi:hypothetical protein
LTAFKRFEESFPAKFAHLVNLNELPFGAIKPYIRVSSLVDFSAAFTVVAEIEVNGLTIQGLGQTESQGLLTDPRRTREKQGMRKPLFPQLVFESLDNRSVSKKFSK